MSVNDVPEVGSKLSSRTRSNADAPIAVSIWFDMQPDAFNESVVPLWARELAQAHADNTLYLIAHPDSAYAKMGLLCEIAKESLWPNDAWAERLRAALALAKSKNAQQLILLLPHRAPPALWCQWSLIELAKCGGGLDNLTGLLHGVEAWEDALRRSNSSRWLMMDRVLTYGTGTGANGFLAQMRAFNPMARWVHEGFNDEKLLLQSLKAYHKNIPMVRIAMKNEDLRAWGTNKVVYFATSSEMNQAKVFDLLDRWREKYSQKMVRLWAVVRIIVVSVPLSVTSIHHLWASHMATNFPVHDFPENRFWILGEGLDAAKLQAEFEQCVA